MINLIDEFREELIPGSYLVVMPISRFEIETQFKIGPFRFYPSDTVDIKALRPIRNKKISDFDGEIIELEGQDLREVITSITGADIEIYQSNTLVAYTTNKLNWDEFLLASHEYDLKLIQRLSRDAEKVMDLIRFCFCRADLIDTLPGQVGTWNGSNGFSSALLYSFDHNESYIIAGSVITHTIVKGIGLELDEKQTSSLDKKYSNFINSTSEVSSIAKLALAMNTGFLESNSSTTKFVRAMILLEFLAFPDKSKYQTFDKVSTQICYHIASDYQHYLSLKKRFYELTYKKDEETQQPIGYRERIVHFGHELEDILDNDEIKIKKLMLELQGYIGKVIMHMIDNYKMSWDEFLKFRMQRKEKLGIK